MWVQRVEAEEGPTGLNAATGELTDLVKAGIIDPAKVTRAALQNAASIAAMVLTTECLVADKPEPAGAGRRRHARRRHGWHARHDVIRTAELRPPWTRSPGRQARAVVAARSECWCGGACVDALGCRDLRCVDVRPSGRGVRISLHVAHGTDGSGAAAVLVAPGGGVPRRHRARRPWACRARADDPGARRRAGGAQRRGRRRPARRLPAVQPARPTGSSTSSSSACWSLGAVLPIVDVDTTSRARCSAVAAGPGRRVVELGVRNRASKRTAAAAAAGGGGTGQGRPQPADRARRRPPRRQRRQVDPRPPEVRLTATVRDQDGRR